MPNKCSFSNISSIGTVVHGNTVYAAGGAMVEGCGKTITVSQWLELGADSGTTENTNGISSASIMQHAPLITRLAVCPAPPPALP